jgi:hypothetical protein
MNPFQCSLVAILLLYSPNFFQAVAQRSNSDDESLGLQRQAFQWSQVKASVPAQIAGHVLRADTGEPMAGVLIILSPVGSVDDLEVSQRTAVDGGYVFEAVSPGAYLLLAYQPVSLVSSTAKKREPPQHTRQAAFP